jgi:hypothetical protein
MIRLFLSPISAILTNRSIGRDGLHDGAAAFLLNHFRLLTHDNLANFSFARLRDRTKNAATDFAGRFVPDQSLSRVVLFAIQGLRHGLHDGESFFTISRFEDLSSDLILLFAECDFVHRTVMGFLHVFVRGFVDGAVGGVLLRFLNRCINRPLARLPFDAASGVAA